MNQNIFPTGRKFPPVETFYSGLHYNGLHYKHPSRVYSTPRERPYVRYLRTYSLRGRKKTNFENFPILPRVDLLFRDKEKL